MISRGDDAVIDRMVDRLLSRFDSIHVLEIGVGRWVTSTGIRDRIGSRLGKYIGIDTLHYAKDCLVPDWARLVMGDSLSAHRVLRDESQQFHLLLIDGCHCLTHAMCDFLNYSPLMVRHGVVAFHDTTPNAQGCSQGECSACGACEVAEAMSRLGLLDGSLRGWRLIEVSQSDDWGGFHVYEKQGD